MITFRRSRNGILPTWLLLVLCLFLSHQSTYGLEQEIIDDLTIPNRSFGLKTMNYFIDLVNEKKKNSGLEMIRITDKNTIQNYGKCKTDDDLQILYSEQMGQDAGINYVTISSRNRYGRCVHVYDSLLRDELSNVQRQIINHRFPTNSLYFHRPWTWHLSETSSGPLAIAYATLLAIGEDPRGYPLPMNMSNSDPTMALRKHILSMFKSRELTLFTKAEKVPTQFHPQIMRELDTANEPFSDVTINYFIQMVRLRTNFDMINLVNYNKVYQNANPEKPDIQILYGDSSSVGYYICVFYEPSSKKVYVYDILLSKKLSSRNTEIIKQRYPTNKGIIFAKPSEQQNKKTKEIENKEGLIGKLKLRFKDKTANKEIIKISSGPMSIAYAASLIYILTPSTFSRSIFGNKKSIHDLQLDRINIDEPIGNSHNNDLRKNILNMFRGDSLPFGFASSMNVINGKYISMKPEPAPYRRSGGSSSSKTEIDGPTSLLLTCAFGFPIIIPKSK